MYPVLKKITLLALAAAGAWFTRADELLLSPCTMPHQWLFVNGGEFPGAAGSLAPGADRQLKLNYDFSQGGQYVAAITRMAIPAGTEKMIFSLEAEQDAEINFRLVDASGRTFQQAPQMLKGGVPSEVAISAAGPWSDAWGGEDGSAVRSPWQEVWLMADKGQELPLAGSIELNELRIEGADLAEAPFSGEDFAIDFNGNTLAGSWRKCAVGAVLALHVAARGDEALELAFDFPMNGRSDVQRFTVSAEADLQIPFPAQNPRNLYQIVMTVRQGDAVLTQKIELAGAEADEYALGKARTAEEIQKTAFGSCTHFSYGKDPLGPFKGWHPWKALIDDMARCGMKIIRDGAGIEKDAAGNYKISDYDREWITYGKSKGLETILVIDLAANMELQDFAKRCGDIAKDTAGLVDVFEIGNEPNNFGDWIKTYGGTWNGKDADGKTSAWVLENLKYANAGAEAVKKARPDSTVIGTGACSPTNIRYLDAGLTAAMDGIVDHPYTYSMPPESVPFGRQLIERDGVDLGDDEHTFEGLIRSYGEHFKRTGTPRSVWITEFGFTTFRFDGKNETGLYAGFSEDAQAAYLLRRQLLTLGLPLIRATTQYDYIDDYQSSAHEAEANFGLVRGDGSHKPAWFALQRFNSLLAETQPADGITATVEAPLHRSANRGALVRDWDNAQLDAQNGVRALPLENPYRGGERLLAVWSMQPFGAEFANRKVTLELDGWTDAELPLTGIDLITGRSFDIPAAIQDGKVRIEHLELEQHPILIRFDQPGR